MYKILMVSLGCDKNLCDSEEMLGLINESGYGITNDENEADIVIINTCSFIKDAMEESITTIFEMAELKKKNLKYIIVAGCLSERFKNEIAEEMPEVDAFLGTTSFDRIIKVIEALDERIETSSDNFAPIMEFCDKNYLPDIKARRIITSGTYMAYLKIAEGCSKYCTYCIIPHIRGKYRSIPMEKLLKQAQDMAEDGIKEIVIVAQETTCYGTDIYGKKCLHELIHKISEIPGIEWIRLLYCYPEEIYDELISEIAENNKVCHYIDMPLQHSETNILKRMGRKTDKEHIKEVISKLKAKVPDIAIRTTFIAGFPGETDKDHEALMEFINEVEFDRLGVFTYSAEDGTPAANMPEQVPEEKKEKYRAEIMELQQEISYDKNESFIGKNLDVIIEGYIPDEDIYAARSYRDAPNVDGMVFVKCDYELMSGSIVNILVTDASEYDLIGEIVE